MEIFMLIDNPPPQIENQGLKMIFIQYRDILILTPSETKNIYGN